MRMTLTLPLLLAAGLASAEPVPFVTQAGHYTLDWTPARQTLEIKSETGTGQYDITGCVFGRRISGVFGLYMAGVNSPHVVQHCETEAGQRLSIYAPTADDTVPVFEIYGESVDYRLGTDRLLITAIRAGKETRIDWRASGATPRRGLAERGVETLPQPLSARRQGLAVLDRQLRDPDARKELAGTESNWPGWDRLLRGGWASQTGSDGRQIAFLPADLANWPRDLEASAYLYGDRSGAQMYAAPHASAPALRLIRRVILSRGPGLEGESALEAAGWLHVCAGPDECGFVRARDVRSPDGPWASFSRAGPEAPWKLEQLQRN
ncbi:MAG: hypothetical protein AAGE80_16600 [Pseudomonadota bacterium]